MKYILLALAMLGVYCVGLPPAMAGEPHVLRIRLTAAGDGGLAKVTLNGVAITPSKDGKRTRLDMLRARVRGVVEDAKGRRKDMDFQAELECDAALQYRHVIELITAISGYKAKPGDGKVVKLIENIKFAPPRRGDRRSPPPR